VNDSPGFLFDFSLLNPEKKKAPHFETSLKIKPKQLFQKIEAIKEGNSPTVNYLLFENYPDKVDDDRFELGVLAAKGFKVYDASKGRQHLPPARTVVDLHIEKLQNDWKHLSNFEILTIQLNEFEKNLDLATAHYQSSLIVIHGVADKPAEDSLTGDTSPTSLRVHKSTSHVPLTPKEFRAVVSNSCCAGSGLLGLRAR
jgi:hypothetical protein